MRGRRLTAQEQFDRAITEANWMNLVAEYARVHGWLVAHFRPSLSGGKHMTAVQYDGAGFLDLVMVRKGELIFAEVKREVRSEVTPEQARWIDELLTVEGIRVVVWRPSDWPKVQKWLA